MKTWNKPKCKDCPYIYYSEKGARCYAIYPYIGISQEYENQHHRKCPITNGYAKPSVQKKYLGVIKNDTNQQ